MATTTPDSWSALRPGDTVTLRKMKWGRLAPDSLIDLLEQLHLSVDPTTRAHSLPVRAGNALGQANRRTWVVTSPGFIAACLIG